MRTFVFSTVILFLVNFLYSQNSWQVDGNNVNKPVGKIGTINNKDLEIITNNATRMFISKNGRIEMYDTVHVKGPLGVGDSSTWIIANQSAQSTMPYTDYIVSNRRSHSFGFSSGPILSTNWANFSNYKMGIGGSHFSYKLQIEAQSFTSGYEAQLGFTNLNTGFGINDGFVLGLPLNSVNGIINLKENGDIRISTGSGANNAIRMTIKGTDNMGYVGIGNNFTNPQSLLHIHENTNNEVYLQISNNATTGNLYSGMALGLNGPNNKRVELRQFSQDDILLRIKHSGDDILRNILILKPNGNTGVFTYDPQAKLHVNGCLEELPYIPNTGNLFMTTGPLGSENKWCMVTRGVSNLGPYNFFEVGKLWTKDNEQNLQHFHIQASRGDLVLHSNGLNSVNHERIRITGTNSSNSNYPQTRVAISANTEVPIDNTVDLNSPTINTPLALLHMGFRIPASFGGFRHWMHQQSDGNSGFGLLITSPLDNMYIGLVQKNQGLDNFEAIINWGNHSTNIDNTQSRLYFNYTLTPSLSVQPGSSERGLETGRIFSDGKISRWGIGDFETPGNDPKRQLDVYDNGLDVAGGRPQFRITQETSSNTLYGKYADFQVTGTNNDYDAGNLGTGGHLLINPRFDKYKKTVAINMENNNTPLFTGLSLDVNGEVNIRHIEKNDNLTKILVWDEANNGRIRWRDISTLGGGGIQYCPYLFSMENDGGYNLKNYNFYFTGNQHLNNASNPNLYGKLGVSIGDNCDTHLLPSKFFVNNYNLYPFYGMYENVASYSIAENSNNLLNHNKYVIGIVGLSKNKIDNKTQIGVAGLCDSDDNSFLNSYGILGVGRFNSNVTPFLSNQYLPYGTYAGVFLGDLYAPNTIYYNTLNHISDSSIKSFVGQFSGALNFLRNINIYYYKYNKIVENKNKIHVGVNAQQVKDFAPFAIDTIYVRMDSLSNDTIPILTVNTNTMLYSTTRAIQELDSIVTDIQQSLPPACPVLISPANNATDVPLEVTLTWSKAKYAQYYVVYVYTKEAREMSVQKGAVMQFYEYRLTTSDTSVTIALPYHCTNYYWNVTAYNTNGSCTSGTLQFNTLLPPLPEQVILASPENHLTNVSLSTTFTWYPALYAQNYKLYISLSENPVDIVQTIATTDTFAVVNLPYCGTTFYWAVVAQNCTGSGMPSEIWSLTTNEYYTPAVQLIYPANNDTVRKDVRFIWHKVQNAIIYNVTISTTQNEEGVVYRASISDTVLYAGEFLKESGQYYWWVRAKNICGAESVPSAIGSFYFISSFLKETPVLSDLKYKTSITGIDSAMNIVQNLNPVYFHWNTASYPELKDNSRQIGLIAQQVQAYIPEVVRVNEDNEYAIDYSRLVPLLIAAIKEQQQTISTLQAELNSISQYLYNVCCPPQEKIQQNNTPQPEFSQNITLSNRKAIILNQNQPNPFKERTTITFQIPEYVQSAQIVFTDINGIILKVVDIVERGYGELIVFSQDLSSGNYLYYLDADGQIVETKKMIVRP